MLEFVIKTLDNVYAKRAMEDHVVISVFQPITIIQIASSAIVLLLEVFHLHAILLANVHVSAILLENNVLNVVQDIMTIQNVYVCIKINE